MFDRLSDGFNSVFRKLSGQGTISEANVREAMDEVRTALLEADVNYDVVDEFCEAVLDDAIGQDVTKSLKPGQEMIGIVNRRLTDLLGGKDDSEETSAALAAAGVKTDSAGPAEAIMRVTPGPTIVMMSGLQGSGKTTTCGKLAAWLAKRGRSTMLAAADLQRPAAVEQLESVAEGVREAVPGSRVEFYGEPDKCAAYGKAVNVAVGVCERALKAARKAGVDVLILDTAGRLHVNDELMGELHKVNRALEPHHIFLVVDAMTGQDAVNSAKAFHERLTVDGVILTKFDSDTRGGAALSVKRVTGAPIKFIGTGEKVDAIEPFHAERMAGRILGMGDVVSLVEKAQEEVTEEEAEKLQAKMMRGELGMDDFLKQLKLIRRMGPLKQVMGMLPGVGTMLKDADVDDKQFDRIEAQINSMTPSERGEPDVINGARRRRIAKGSGVEQQEVSQLVKQFNTINKLTKSMGGMSAKGRVAAARQMSSAGVPGMSGLPGLSTKRSTKSGGGGKRFKNKKRKR
ncbi:MAG: signal recognition particle protein [Planctomycetota bacterium]